MKLSVAQQGAGTLQWFIYILVTSIALPITLGEVFQLSLVDVAGLIQRTLFIVGISSLLHALLTRSTPLVYGPAGSWAGIFVILAGLSAQQGQSPQDALPALAGGMALSGLLLVMLGLFGWIDRLSRLFTPLVTGSFLLILSFQLSAVFLAGMVTDPQTEQFDLATAVIAFSVFIFVVCCSVKKQGLLRNYGVLVGILLGWLLFSLCITTSGEVLPSQDWLALPQLFSWGLPELNVGMVLVSSLFTFTLVSNIIAANRAVCQAQMDNDELRPALLKQSSIAGGISHLLASVFSAIGVVPLPMTAGFLQLTGLRQMLPFILACIVLSLFALIPPLIGLLAQVPAAVANAVLMASFIKLVGLSLQAMSSQGLTQRDTGILGITLLFSMAIMMLPGNLFDTLPASARYVFGNPLLMGTLICMLLERVWPKDTEVFADASS